MGESPKETVLKNEKITNKIFSVLKKSSNKLINQYVYISDTLPSGHWKLKIIKKIQENDITIIVSKFKEEVMAAAVLNSAYFYIETNKNCTVNFIKD